MGIEFPIGSDACDSYGYTFDSNCTADVGGATLGYDQNFTYTELADGTKAWVPLNGVLKGTNGRDGNQGDTGPAASPTGPQGFMGVKGPDGEDGDDADPGTQGPTGPHGETFPAQNQSGTDVELSYRFKISFATPYTAKRWRSNTSLDYGGLETVAPRANHFAQFHLQSGRNDLTRDIGYRSPISFSGEIDRYNLGLWNAFISAGGTTFSFDPVVGGESTKATFPNFNSTGVWYPAFQIVFDGGNVIGDPNDNPPFPHFVISHPTTVSSFGLYDNDAQFNLLHPLRHINADDCYHFSLFRREKELPANAWYSRLIRGGLGSVAFYYEYIRDLVEFDGFFNEVVEITTPSGTNSGIDLNGITGIGSTLASPLMGRVIEFPYVDLFRQFQGAVPSTGATWQNPGPGSGWPPVTEEGKFRDPYGTLPMPGDPIQLGNRAASNSILSDTGAVSRIRELNMQWAREEAVSGSGYDTELGQFNHNPFNYAPLNTSTSEGTGDAAQSWKTVYGGRIPYMFYFGGPCILADGNPASGFSASKRWNSTKGSDNKNAIYIQEILPDPGSDVRVLNRAGSANQREFDGPTGDAGPWPLRQSMHFNGYKYTNAGATMIDKVVFLTGTGYGSGKELALGTGGSVTLTFSQFNQETNDGGPTYGFAQLFEFVAGTCADTDPKVSSTDTTKVKFLGGETHAMGTKIGDTDVFHIFCTGLLGGTAGYLISHQQYHG